MQSFQLSSHPGKSTEIYVVVQGGGGGHHATYKALCAIVKQQQLPWKLTPIAAETIVERLTQQNKSLLNIYGFFGTNWTEVYDQILKKGLTWLFPLQAQLNKLLFKLNYDMGRTILEEEWQKRQPDLILSIIPCFNKLIWESIQCVKPNTPVVTILTDFADCPPGCWIEPQTKNYVVCGTEKASEQAQALGIEKAQIIRTSGLVIHPRFYQPIEIDRRLARAELGLDADCFTGLVLFGSNGSQVMLDIAKSLEYFQQKLQLIFLCGHNEDIASSLRQHEDLQKRLVVTFTKDIPYYMNLADFFIGKPGNISISEALAMNLPVITERNFSTLPHERYVTNWIRENEVGIVIPSFRNIKKAVEKFLKPDIFTRYCDNASALNNQAIFEIPGIIEEVLAERNGCLEDEKLSSASALNIA